MLLLRLVVAKVLVVILVLGVLDPGVVALLGGGPLTVLLLLLGSLVGNEQPLI